MIQITVIGTTPKQLAEMIEIKSENVKMGLVETATEARKMMADIIGLGYQGKGKRDGSHGKLEGAIKVEKLADDEVGVGNILEMNKDVPYWMLLNNGGMVSPGARKVAGYFGNDNAPNSSFTGTGVGKEQFFNAWFTHMMIVKNPIGAVNYIEKTKDWLKTVMGARFSAWVNKKSVR